MTPAELLDDHQRRPRNLGRLPSATAVGDVGSIVVGDALRVYLLVEAGRIAQARFQVFNATPHIAHTSALTEMLVGRTPEEAAALGPADLCRHLGGLDPVELPPLPWGFEGVRAAAAALAGREYPFDVQIEPLLCRCVGVPEQTVRQAIAAQALTTVDAVVAATGAGSVCGSCRVDIERMLVDPRAAPGAARATAKPASPLGRIATMRRIRELVTQRMLPGVQAAGGEIELWDFDGAVVSVRVGGTLAADATATARALGELEAILRSEIEPTLRVSTSAGDGG